MAGVYIHVPFCKKACHYCNFHFTTSKNYNQLINTIILEIETNKKNFNKKDISTIYFGGGTPSIIERKLLESIINKIKIHYKVKEECEITLESNPDDITEKKLIQWKKIGINRISLGVQSFDDSILKRLNRIHNCKEAKVSIELIKKHFNNYSVDLMFGTPLSSTKTTYDDLKIISLFDPPHVSIYNMTIEKNTVFHKLLKDNKISLPGESKILDQYDIILEKLKKLGYENYEISNFAKQGYRSKHNSNYWDDKEYIGFGPSAHSYDKKYRYWNTNKNEAYINLIQKKEIHYEKEELTLEQKINEYIITKIRTIEGINGYEFNKKFNINFFKEKNLEILKLIKDKLVVKKRKYLNLTDKGKKLSDYITEKIMY